MSNDPTSMMGGGLCWLDYDADGWLDLFVVNSYTDTEFADWDARGGPPRTALFRNVQGTFEDVSRESGAALPLRGNGCVAADFDLDGAHRPVRDDRGVQRRDRRLRRTSVERRRRHVHGGSARRRDHRARLACGGCRRRRERGRAARSVRRVVCGSERQRPVVVGLPDEPTRRTRSPVPQRRTERGGSRALPRGRATGRYRAQRDRTRPRSRPDGLRPRRAARPVRGQRRRSQPAVPERPAIRGARLRLPGGRRAGGCRRPERRDGNRRRGLQPRRKARPLRHELPPAAARRLSEPACPRAQTLVRRRPTRARDRARHTLDGLGHVMGGPRPRR